MTDLAPIYAPWDGNAQAMANEIGVPGVTVRQWRARGSIPPRYWPMIIDAAAERGAVLTASDFPKDADLQAFAALVLSEAA